MEILEYEAYAGIAEGSQGAVAHAFDGLAGDFDSAGSRTVEQTYDIEQCGFTAARWTHNAHKFAFIYCKIHIVESHSLDFARAIELAYAINLYHFS